MSSSDGGGASAQDFHPFGDHPPVHALEAARIEPAPTLSALDTAR